ncbi:LysR family transcriptional regulator for bpeEF and oprC [Acinetobacter baylyi]|uniref:LysR family transcriptional regulator for bpeEF and oprC n=1 Tax=Acinetobacter baylyi TaxID=202950 RepID=A0ABU0UYI2_ACIBI|nr:LysR family transcriptional regulator [Acinetobacter baylyi]MDQ1209626.1 LysR family transcriptional regulator for bpeEF and oprC [Acinetobacter baylyi]MDR6106778.1 LysR family transcriptional regulator for bpeEF and oprC [Acinetobacter baylyi]MDR6186497.1 LysR family transcriptional regulator for bpeEF and oprC [Acinetobacter baylyi]
MDRLQQFEIFIEVAKRESFSEATLRLDLPRSTVTAAIQNLEASYKVRLFQRTTRRVSLTHDGKRILPECQNLLADYQLLEQMIQTHHQDYQGIIKVDMPSRISHQIVVPAIGDFFQQYPHIRIQLHSSDHLTNLVEQEVDCVVRVGILENSSLIAKTVGHLSMVNCASPTYLQTFGVPQQLEDLHQHQLVNYQNGVGDQQGSFFYGDQYIKLNTRLSVNNTEAYIQAARAGLGIIQVPYYDVYQDLLSGRLVEILKDDVCPSLPLNVLYPNRHYIPRRLDVFMSWLIPLLQRQCCIRS